MPTISHFADVRRVQKQKLLRFIQEHKDMSIEKILALFSLETGQRVTTLKVYVDELRSAELIE